MFTYIGYRDAGGTAHAVIETRDGKRFRLPLRLDLENKSPTGPEWGYAGSGPAQLALALVAHATGDNQLALRTYQAFKRRVVAGLPRDLEWRMTDDQIEAVVHQIVQAKKAETCANSMQTSAKLRSPTIALPD